jgi:hypothetical protein
MEEVLPGHRWLLSRAGRDSFFFRVGLETNFKIVKTAE